MFSIAPINQRYLLWGHITQTISIYFGSSSSARCKQLLAGIFAALNKQLISMGYTQINSQFADEHLCPTSGIVSAFSGKEIKADSTALGFPDTFLIDYIKVLVILGALKNQFSFLSSQFPLWKR